MTAVGSTQGPSSISLHRTQSSRESVCVPAFTERLYQAVCISDCCALLQHRFILLVRAVSASKDGTLKLWDLLEPNCIETLRAPDPMAFTCVDVTTYNRFVAHHTTNSSTFAMVTNRICAGTISYSLALRVLSHAFGSIHTQISKGLD